MGSPLSWNEMSQLSCTWLETEKTYNFHLHLIAQNSRAWPPLTLTKGFWEISVITTLPDYVRKEGENESEIFSWQNPS